jgi:transcriptional regulator with XRE-family HTH domain
MALSAQQIRMARASLRWSIADLAEKSGVAVSTVKRAEAVDGPLPVTRPNADAMQRALEAAGVEFIPENGGGAGVRLKRRPTPPGAGAGLLLRIRATGADVAIDGERLVAVRGDLIPDDLWSEAQANLKDLAAALECK